MAGKGKEIYYIFTVLMKPSGKELKSYKSVLIIDPFKGILPEAGLRSTPGAESRYCYYSWLHPLQD